MVGRRIAGDALAVETEHLLKYYEVELLKEIAETVTAMIVLVYKAFVQTSLAAQSFSSSVRTDASAVASACARSISETHSPHPHEEQAAPDDSGIANGTLILTFTRFWKCNKNFV